MLTLAFKGKILDLPDVLPLTAVQATLLAASHKERRHHTGRSDFIVLKVGKPNDTTSNHFLFDPWTSVQIAFGVVRLPFSPWEVKDVVIE